MALSLAQAMYAFLVGFGFVGQLNLETRSAAIMGKSFGYIVREDVLVLEEYILDVFDA